ncbi:MAG: proline iminopeptidase-family hydrolase [Victivallales bacterium]|nr:proline iminopeptidase-family hydrolase [Victivallales bacterium]
MTGKRTPNEPRHRFERQEGYVTVPGGKVWYRIAGVDQPGLPLLVLHGGPGATHDYLEPLAALADERPVIFYDQLDCGKSEKTDNPEDWTIARYLAELHQVCRTLNLRRVHLLGQSWGAVLAVEYALGEGSDRAASLVLSGPLLNTAQWLADQNIYIDHLPPELRDIIRHTEAAEDFASPAYQDAMMAYYRRHVCRLETWPKCLNRSFSRVNPKLYQYMWGPSEFTVTGTLKRYDVTARLPELTLPVLFTCGADDEAAPETVRGYRDRVPGADIHVFAAASHEHHLEQPEEYLAVVRQFLSRADHAAAAEKRRTASQAT